MAATEEGNAPAGSVFSPHFLAFALQRHSGSYERLDLLATLAIANRWREALLSHSNGLSNAARTVLSGHHADGSAADEPHLAFLPLAFVDHEQADGQLLGMGLVLPADLPREVRRDVLHAVEAVRRDGLKLGPLGVWTPEPVMDADPPWNLAPGAWTAEPHGVTHWSTVTPIVFDRHAKARNKARHQQQAADGIAQACTRIGLPVPREVIVTQVSAHHGVPPSFRFPRMQRKDGSDRRHTHAILVFDEPVRGPVLIGAGRFRGYGVCRGMGVGS